MSAHHRCPLLVLLLGAILLVGGPAVAGRGGSQGKGTHRDGPDAGHVGKPDRGHAIGWHHGHLRDLHRLWHHRPPEGLRHRFAGKRRWRRPGVAPEGVEASSVFWIHGEPIAANRRFRSNDAIVIEDGRISTLSGCPPVEGAFEAVGGGGLPGPDDVANPIVFGEVREIHVVAEWSDCAAGRRGRGTGAAVLDALWSVDDGVLQGRITYELLPFDRPVVATTTSQDTIRIGTYNVQFLPSIAFSKSPTIAKRIADRIVASRYDIIVLNEAFDEDVRSGEPDSFVENLQGTYPYRVEYLTGDSAYTISPNEDSGLMLFSRFPIEPLPRSTFEVGFPKSACEGTDCSRVAFIEFQACEDDDCFSEKGAGYVRIRNPQTNRIYNVVFTHMQASYLDDGLDDWFDVWDVREAQMNDIEALLAGSITETQRDSEDIFVLGDLNIDGDLADGDLGLNPDQQNLHEWIEFFDTPGSFYTDVLHDAWAFETSPDDRGLTNLVAWGNGSDDGSRLDYFLRSTPEPLFALVGRRSLCTFHLSLSHNLRDGAPFTESNLGEPGTEAGPLQLSDHIGVTADLGASAPFCSAAAPRDVPLPLPGDSAPLGGEIETLGGMQWFRFDEAGTYSFALPGKFEYHVYEATDLSTPILPYKDKQSFIEPQSSFGLPPIPADKFRVPEAPFYVRVYDAQRSGKGTYTLWARQHRCTGIGDTCFLAPGQRLDQHFAANVPLGADDTAWFELETEQADQGGAQELGFHVTGLAAGAPVKLEVHEVAMPGSTLVDEDSVAEPDPGVPGTWRLDVDREEAAEKGYYLLVERLDVTQAIDATVSWTTDLTVLHGSQVGVSGAVPMMLVNVEQEDFNGNDDIYFSMSVDGVEVIHQQDVGEFDIGTQKSLETWIGTRRFLDEITITLFEQDANKDGGPPGGDDDVTIEVVSPLDRDAAPVQNAHEAFMWDPPAGSASSFSGHYELQLNLSHGLDKK